MATPSFSTVPHSQNEHMIFSTITAKRFMPLQETHSSTHRRYTYPAASNHEPLCRGMFIMTPATQALSRSPLS